MKASEIIDAMAALNDETLEEVGALRQAPEASAAREKAPSRPRRYWWIAAACLIFAVAFFGIITPSGMGTTIFHYTLAANDTDIYYVSSKRGFLSRSYIPQGVYYYNRTTGEKIRIASDGRLIQTTLGPVLVSDYSYYLLKGTETEFIGKISLTDAEELKHIEYLDADENYLYYSTGIKNLYRDSIQTGKAERLISRPGNQKNSTVANAANPVMDDLYLNESSIGTYKGQIYYADRGNDDGLSCLVIKCLDPDSEKVKNIWRIDYNDYKVYPKSYYLYNDHYLFVYGLGVGIYRIDLDTKELKRISDKYVSTVAVYDNRLYVLAYENRTDDGFTDSLTVSCDYNGENMREYSNPELFYYPREQVFCEDGYYYTVAGGPDLGLYFFSFKTGETLKID